MNKQLNKIRRAHSGDEFGLAQVHVKSWQETYKGLVPQNYLDQLPSEIEERVSEWKKTLVNPKRWTFVAENSQGLAGFILFGLPRDPNKEGFIELGAIYLLASEKGQGIGFALLSAGFNLMRELGYKSVYCWVLENNPTIKFYEKTGATFTGDTKDDEIGGKKLVELAYQWQSLEIGRERLKRGE